MTKETVLGIIRHTLTFASGFIIANNPAFGDEIGVVTGSVVGLFGAVWSIIDKARRNGLAKKK